MRTLKNENIKISFRVLDQVHLDFIMAVVYVGKTQSERVRERE